MELAIQHDLYFIKQMDTGVMVLLKNITRKYWYKKFEVQTVLNTDRKSAQMTRLEVCFLK